MREFAVSTLTESEAAEHDDGSVLLGEALRHGERPHDVGHVPAGHVLHCLGRSPNLGPRLRDNHATSDEYCSRICTFVIPPRS